jgi:putative transposase
MPRLPRLHVPAGCYHVILRGNHREDIFGTRQDRLILNSIVAEAIEYYTARVHAYCWMTNHLHALIQIGIAPLGDLIKRIASRYSRYRHRQLNTTGHLFERRHRAWLIETDLYFITLLRYIHWNPVKAGVAAHLEEYEWSSHRAYLGLETRAWLNTDFGLSLFGADVDSARRSYRCLMDQAMHDSEERILEQANPYDRRVLGSDGFLESLPAIKFTPKSSLTLSGLIDQVCVERSVALQELRSPSKRAALSKARAEIARRAIEGRIASLSEVARFLSRTHSTLGRLLQRHSATKNGTM